MHVAPQAELGDGLLDVLTVGDFGKFVLLMAFPRIYKGTHITHPKVRMEKARHITIDSSERLLVHADGELLGEATASFWLMPSALRIVAYMPRYFPPDRSLDSRPPPRLAERKPAVRFWRFSASETPEDYRLS